MKLYKLLFIFCILVFAFGCGKKENSNKVIVWHWMTDRDDAFIELANKYKQLYGVDVSFELYAPSEAYSSRVKAAAQTKTLPDIFGVLSEKRDFASFINAGHIANLQVDMNENNGEWKNKLFEKVVSINEFKKDNSFNVKAGVYGVPIDVNNIQLVYNKKMFKAAGLDPENPPKNWNDFLDAWKKLKAAGSPGLVSGFGEIWLLDCFASNYAFNIMGEKKVLATIKGDVKYTDPDWIKVLSIFEQIRDNNILVSGAISMINKTAEQMFANERASMAFNGSWCVNVYKSMNPSLEYGVISLPSYSNEHPMVIWGGGASFMINNNSPRKLEAIKFLKWLTEKEQQVFLAETTRNLPVNNESLTNLDPVLQGFANGMDKSISLSNLPYIEFPSVTEVLDKGIQSIIIGERTPKDVLLEVQKVKEVELAKIESQKIK